MHVVIWHYFMEHTQGGAAGVSSNVEVIVPEFPFALTYSSRLARVIGLVW